MNGRRVPAEAIQALERQYATLGQTPPGFAFGGAALRADASGGGTPVSMNGRVLHPSEIVYLQRCIPVLPGRCWMNAAGIAGSGGVYTPFGRVTQAAGSSATHRLRARVESA